MVPRVGRHRRKQAADRRTRTFEHLHEAPVLKQQKSGNFIADILLGSAILEFIELLLGPSYRGDAAIYEASEQISASFKYAMPRLRVAKLPATAAACFRKSDIRSFNERLNIIVEKCNQFP
jgi:hypothetical protein